MNVRYFHQNCCRRPSVTAPRSCCHRSDSSSKLPSPTFGNSSSKHLRTNREKNEIIQGLRKPLKMKHFSAPAPNQGLMKNHLFAEMYTILPASLQGLTQGLRKTNKNRALFRSTALPGLNEKPSFSRDVYKSADFAPGPYPGLKENH